MNDAMLASGPVNDTGGVRYRAAAVAVGAAEIRRAENGAWYLRSREPLGDYPTRLTDCLVNGAQAHPDRVLAAKRGDDGRWIEITYAQMLERARALGQGLVDLGLSAERPLAVLSGNDLEHLQLMFAAMLAGVPYSPISPAYSLVSTDYGKLRHTLGVLKPGAVFVAERAPFVRALDAVLPADAALIVARDDDADVDADGKGRAVPLSHLLATAPRTIDAIHAAVGPDHLAKILFTSGSTKQPKAVPTTHRMLCSNQQMLRQTMPELMREPPVLVDWLPWNHTFGGSHNLGIALYNGGTLYIDDGRPMPGRFDETVRNLREIAPTIYFNVPKGWEELTAALERDAAARHVLLAREAVFLRWRGPVAGRVGSARPRDRSALRRADPDHGRPRDDGGVAVVPVHDGAADARRLYRAARARLRREARAAASSNCASRPNVMRGYWHADVDPRDVFDDEGYYRSGDAGVFADPARPGSGCCSTGG